MTPEQQRIAIAEACGYWFYKESTDINTRVYAGPPGSGLYRFLGYIGGATAEGSPLPDYLKDLNAMHEAEKMLRVGQHFTFQVELARVINTITYPLNFALLHATAAQRAEAFLKTLNLWKP